jgi:hypothetical protein
MRRGRLAIVPLVVGPLLGLAAALPAAAGTIPVPNLPALPGHSHARSAITIPERSPSAMAGFVLWDNPGVNHQTTYNSRGGVVSVTPSSTGVYRADFHLLGFPGGDVQVSALDGTCSVFGWFPSGGDLMVDVDCYDAAGAPANQAFYLMVTQPTGAAHGVIDYDWAYKGHGKLTGGYQFNSSHKTNSIAHPGTGRYVVTMPGPRVIGANTGTVKVSAYGAGAGNCLLAGWRSTRTGQQISVDCFAASGARQDRLFTVEYVRGNNLMGINGKIDANALANGSAALYQPRVQFDSGRRAKVTVIHLDRGLYEVVFVGSNPTSHFSGGLGHLQFTAVGTTYRGCGFTILPSHTPFALVGCTSPAGPINTAFTIQWVVN